MNNKHPSPIGILGHGPMPGELALLAAGYGNQVLLYTGCAAEIARCEKLLQHHLAEILRAGKLSQNQADTCLSRICFARDPKELSPCDIVFETGKTLLDKCHWYDALTASECVPRAVISMTTTLLPDEMAEVSCCWKEKLVAAHAFSPAHLIPLYELAAGTATSPDALTAAREWLTRTGRTVVVLKKTIRGFISSRVQYALIREACDLVESGTASIEGVDIASRYSVLPRYSAIGPLEGMDNAGLDLATIMCDRLFPSFQNPTQAQALLRDKLAAKHTGAATGQGLYHWDPDQLVGLESRINRPWWKFFNWPCAAQQSEVVHE